MTADEEPIIDLHAPPPEPDPREVRFVPKLTAAPLDLPRREPVDRELAKRRAHAEHFCLWLGCSRVLCRRARHCLGIHADCVFEMDDVSAPLLG